MYTAPSSPYLRALTAAALLIFATSSASAAPPTLNYLFPAGAQRGTTAAVTAGGSFDRWPVKGWASHAGIVVTSAKEKGQLSIAVAADVPPGTHWLRLYDEQGASALRPFVVGTLPEVMEEEPNDDPKKPQVLPSSTVVVNGRLARTGDVDCFAVHLRKGQTLIASVDANRTLGSPMDAILQIVSADGFVLQENNDYHDLDPQLALQAPADGMFIVRTFAFPANPDSSIRFAGGEQYVYRLTLTTGGFIDFTMPLAVERPGMDVRVYGWNIAPDAHLLRTVPTEDPGFVRVFHPRLANALVLPVVSHPSIGRHASDIILQPVWSLPVTVTGRLGDSGWPSGCIFEAKKGQRVHVRVESRDLGYLLDSVVTLTDPSGKLVARVDDAGSPRRGSRDPELDFVVSQDGSYTAHVRDLHGKGGSGYAYRLTIALAEPTYTLTVPSDRFTGAPGKPVDVAVAIDRQNGFAGVVDLRAEGLPNGAKAEVVQPPAARAGAKTLTLRLSCSDPVSAPFRIVGRAPELPGPERRARAGLPGLNSATAELWLTIPPPPKQ